MRIYNKYINYQNIVSRIDIKKGDTILVSSDILKLICVCRENGESFNPDLFIDSLIKKIGPEGTVVFPTYNWDFCKGIPFDYYKTLSQVGALGNVTLKRKDFRRTKHPIYSFVVWGKDKDFLCSLNNHSAWGKDSPFAYLHERGAKNLFIGLDYKDGLTMDHYFEEKVGVDYRYFKNFTAQYTDENGKTRSATYGMYVRDLSLNVATRINPLMDDILLKAGHYQEYLINGIKFGLMDLLGAGNVMEKDIQNKGNLIYPKKIDCPSLEDPCIGKGMYSFAERLFPICRSISGEGTRETLRLIQQHIPLNIHEVPTGTKAFDWVVPKEWNIKDAYVIDEQGNKVIDFKRNNLHVVGYSTPVNKKLTLPELQKYLYSLPEQPEAIPYITSYYQERWGFCMAHKDRENLREGEYWAVIDSELKDGSLTYGELIVPGKSDKEVFISTYVCHPSMANNELSGPVVATYLVKWLLSKPRRYTYRVIFIPETIGSIVYLSKNLEQMKEKIIAGFNITCVGDGGTFSYLPTKYGNTYVDKVALNVLSFKHRDFIKYSFLERGSDERQYCSVGIDMPVCSIMRSKYGTYPEYHTSLDNLDFISSDGLFGSYNTLKECLVLIENNNYYQITCLGEPQLGKRGLCPTLSTKDSTDKIRTMLNFIAYADGNKDLIDISEYIKVPVWKLYPIIEKLLDAGLIKVVSGESKR